MVKSSRSHYACHCVALHYDGDDDDDDDTGYDGYEDGYVALASDDGDGSDNDNNLLNPHISDLFFYIFHDAFPADTNHLIKLIKHLDPLCNNVTSVCYF